MSDSLQPHGLQHTRPPCPTPTPGAYSNSCPLNRPSNHPLLSLSPPAFNLSQNRGLFKWVSSLHQVVKVLEFSFIISISNEYSWLISFRFDWFDLFAVQGTLKNLLQHHSSKASILWCSAFFMVQLSHPCMTTGNIITLTRQTLFSWAPKLLWTVTVAMKLKDTCSLEEKLWST